MTAPMTSREALLETAEAGLRHAEGLSAQLAKPDWKPGRAHIEQARNSIQKLAELLRGTDAAQTTPTLDAARYRRLQILGCAPGESKQLEAGTVLRFSGLDAHVDADIVAHPSRGEAPVTSTTQGGTDAGNT